METPDVDLACLFEMAIASSCRAVESTVVVIHDEYEWQWSGVSMKKLLLESTRISEEKLPTCLSLLLNSYEYQLACCCLSLFNKLIMNLL